MPSSVDLILGMINLPDGISLSIKGAATNEVTRTLKEQNPPIWPQPCPRDQNHAPGCRDSLHNGHADVYKACSMTRSQGMQMKPYVIGRCITCRCILRSCEYLQQNAHFHPKTVSVCMLPCLKIQFQNVQCPRTIYIHAYRSSPYTLYVYVMCLHYVLIILHAPTPLNLCKCSCMSTVVTDS